MNYELRIKKNKNSGFTIIETMISVSLFIIIVTAGMGALLNANLLHQKSQNMRSIMDNLSFIMEDMSNNLRTGYSYHCINGSDFYGSLATPLSGTNCWGIAFEYQNGSQTDSNDQWVYFIDNSGKIWKSTQGPYVNPPINYVQLTPDEVTIDVGASGFSVLGAESPRATVPDFQQPFVTIRLKGKITYNNTETPFSLQTSISQRGVDR